MVKHNIFQETLSSLKKLLFLSLIICIVSGIVGITGLCLDGSEEWNQFAPALGSWVLGNWFGVLICTPAFATMALLIRKHIKQKQRIISPVSAEAALWICCIIASFLIPFNLSHLGNYNTLNFSFVPLALLIWSALRFQPIYTNTAVMLISLTVWSSIGLGVMGVPSPASQTEVSALLLFIATIAFFPMLIAIKTEQSRKLQANLQFHAYHDTLTGLLNRRGFESQVLDFLENPPDCISSGLLFLNIDRLKVVNDACGHIAGDHLLEQIGALIQNHCKQTSIIGRFGGDTYAVFIKQTNPDRIRKKSETIRQLIQEYKFSWEGHSFNISASIGVLYINSPRSLTFLLAKGDMACHLSKDDGGNKVTYLESEDQTLMQRRRSWSFIGRVEDAIKQNNFILFAQPILPLQNPDDPAHVEILLRMFDANGDMLQPASFLPIAEANHLMKLIDYWVVDRTLNLVETHSQLIDSNIKFCINLSGQSINSTTFQDRLINRLSNSTVPGSNICFEITESEAIDNLKMARRFINKIKSFNCSFALDDFGKGFSSFSYIKNLPVDYVKIDGSFIKDVISSQIDRAMIRAVTDICKGSKLKTIAEYIESEEIKIAVTNLGIDYGQGTHLGHPVPFIEVLKNHHKHFSKLNSTTDQQQQPDPLV